MDQQARGLENGTLQPLVIRVIDGKPGHESQTGGLVSALLRIGTFKVVDLKPLDPSGLLSLGFGYRGQFARFAGRNPLILCCGHRTHLTALALQRAVGGRVVVLMRPTLPLGLFDLAVIPKHDSPPTDANVFATSGVLNPMRAEGRHAPGRGVFLIGGPSRRSGWDNATLLRQIASIAGRTSETQWALTDSRRTPPETKAALKSSAWANVNVTPDGQTWPGWVADHLAAAGTAWITEDSVSMVYEALTAGAAVGLLSVPRLKLDRVTRGIDALVEAGRVTRFADWRAGKPLCVAQPPLAEADRVAAEIVRRGFL